jgi:hypothetical protein
VVLSAGGSEASAAGGGISLVLGAGAATDGILDVSLADGAGSILRVSGSALMSGPALVDVEQRPTGGLTLEAGDAAVISGASFQLAAQGGLNTLTTASRAGATGSLDLATGSALAGAGAAGSISIRAGGGHSGAGGSVVLSAGGSSGGGAVGSVQLLGNQPLLQASSTAGLALFDARLVMLSLHEVAFETTRDAEGRRQMTVEGAWGSAHLVHIITQDPGPGPLRVLFRGVASGQMVYLLNDCASLAGAPITVLPAYPSGALQLTFGVLHQAIAYGCVADAPPSPYSDCRLLAVGAPGTVP